MSEEMMCWVRDEQAAKILPASVNDAKRFEQRPFKENECKGPNTRNVKSSKARRKVFDESYCISLLYSDQNFY